MQSDMMSGFLNELQAIEKEAGVGSFLAKGFRGLGHLASGKMKVTGKHGLTGMASKAYQKGGGGLSGVKNVAKSQVGRMAGAAAVPVAAGYGIAKATD